MKLMSTDEEKNLNKSLSSAIALVLVLALVSARIAPVGASSLTAKEYAQFDGPEPPSGSGLLADHLSQH